MPTLLAGITVINRLALVRVRVVQARSLKAELQLGMMRAEQTVRRISRSPWGILRAEIKPRTPKQSPLDLVLAITFLKVQIRW
jgi:hypothetical protein